jgi:hypothetical protein
MFNWGVVAKIVGSLLGVAGYAAYTFYQANPNASGKALLMAAVGAVASYLLGLFQAQPTSGNTPKPLVNRQEAP